MRWTIICATLLLMIGCATTKQIGRIEQKLDSVRIDTRIEYIERIDTVLVPLQQSEKSVVIPDTTSYLENKYCSSMAKVNQQGQLMHNLTTKPGEIPVPVKIKEIVRDSIVYQDRIRYIDNPIEVKMPYTTFEKIEIYGFWILLAGLIITILIKIKF